jgi:hypothetical protein
MGLLYGRAGRLTPQNGGFRRGQEYEDVPGTDGKVQKKSIRDGSGWKKPGDNDICKLNMKVCLEDGTVVAEIGGEEPAEYITNGGFAPVRARPGRLSALSVP